jgi:hypothetical protein
LTSGGRIQDPEWEFSIYFQSFGAFCTKMISRRSAGQRTDSHTLNCGLHYGAVGTSNRAEWYANNVLAGMWKEAVVGYFEVLILN